MSAIEQADDGLNPIVKKKELFFEFCKRRNSLIEKYRPTTPKSPNKRRFGNSFKEHVLKEFYYEWKADDVNQKYLKKKVTHFMLRDVPRLRSEHRIYM